jgi:hypothetical protein
MIAGAGEIQSAVLGSKPGPMEYEAEVIATAAHISVNLVAMSRLGSVVVSVLATGPKGCGFKIRPR